ncbi:MAG: VOC family protein [Bacteroidales bacterium]
MKRTIAQVSLVVKDYDEAIDFYVNKLNFVLIEDTLIPEQKKRWVVVAPSESSTMTLLLAKASNESQADHIGNQTGGRVFLFLSTDDFYRDYNYMVKGGVEFMEDPRKESYGTVAVFKDLYGNLWDLIESNED